MVDGTTSEHTRKMERAHNEHILELVDQSMAARGVSPADLDGVAFGCGPGSFTGIRIAASVAQAVALGADARILPVSSTLALAAAAVERHPLADGIVVSIRSRRDAWYLAGFDVAGSELLVRHRDCLVETDPGWPEIERGWPFVGDRPEWLPVGAVYHAEIAPGAGLIARLGAEAMARGKGLAPELGLPVYVTGDSPWRKSRTGAVTMEGASREPARPLPRQS